MKNFTKVLSLLLALTMLLCFPVAVSAAELEDAPIDESRTGSLTIYKYDLTNAEKDGVWDSSYVSTGVFDQTGVNDVLGSGSAALGNGETGYGYAIKGVEFSYVQVADIVQFSESEADSRTDSHVEVLYAIDKAKGADFLKALNLTDGKDRYYVVDHVTDKAEATHFVPVQTADAQGRMANLQSGQGTAGLYGISVLAGPHHPAPLHYAADHPESSPGR